MMPNVWSRHPLARRASLAVALACLLTAAAGAVAARAATLTTDARCYLQGAPLRLTAGGLAPGAPLTVTLDGQVLGYGNGATPTADVAGTFASSFSTPSLPAGVAQRRHVLAVGDGSVQPSARFAVTRPTGAAFEPSSGDPRTLHARFVVWGFALADGIRRKRVWLHWLSPAGTVRASARLGRTRGACGALTTAPRRVFPFDPEPGRWRLLLDAHRRYRVHASGPRAKIRVRVRTLVL